MEGFMELLEKIGNAPFDIRPYPAYIQLCEKQDADTKADSKPPVDPLDDEESEDEEQSVPGPLATDARMTMVQVLAATNGASRFLIILALKMIAKLTKCNSEKTAVWLPLLRNKIATLDALNKPDDVNTLLQLFRNARNDYLCTYIYIGK
jgi:hypothetical protein